MEQEQKQKILKKRAEKTAQARNREEKSEMIEVVIFYLNQEKYAIESIYIREIFLVKELTIIPGTPPFVAGLINVRRKIITVINLKIIFDINKEETLINKVIILENKETEYALLTDDIEQTRLIPIKTIQAPLPTLTGIKQEFLKGITPDQIIILDGDKLLKDKRLVVYEEP